jgi:hypothetical protein
MLLRYHPHLAVARAQLEALSANNGPTTRVQGFLLITMRVSGAAGRRSLDVAVETGERYGLRGYFEQSLFMRRFGGRPVLVAMESRCGRDGRAVVDGAVHGGAPGIELDWGCAVQVADRKCRRAGVKFAG